MASSTSNEALRRSSFSRCRTLAAVCCRCGGGGGGGGGGGRQSAAPLRAPTSQLAPTAWDFDDVLEQCALEADRVRLAPGTDNGGSVRQTGGDGGDLSPLNAWMQLCAFACGSPLPELRAHSRTHPPLSLPSLRCNQKHHSLCSNSIASLARLQCTCNAYNAHKDEGLQAPLVASYKYATAHDYLMTSLCAACSIAVDG